MKPSYYNVEAPLGDGSEVVYNTLHRSLAHLSAQEASFLRQPSPVNPQLERELAQAHFLLEDPEAEANHLLYRHNAHRNNMRALDITISPTRMCNFSCNYCYTKKPTGVMDEKTQCQIVEFLARHYDRAAFSTLKVNWYGGEPLLAIDVIEQLTDKLLAFCSKRHVAYRAHVLTNGSLADAAMCKRLATRCHVRTIMPTISGNGIMHDWQRCANDGVGHFDELMRNIGHMLDAGLTVHANFVLNHNNFQECKQLARRLAHEPGVEIRCTRTFDYGQGPMFLSDGKNTLLQLFTRAEFAPRYAEFHRALGLSAREYAEVIKPIPLYCAAWSTRTFFIGETGDVFQCMIDMDYPERRLCHVSDELEGNAAGREVGREAGRTATRDAAGGRAGGRAGEPFNWKRYLEYASSCPAQEQRCRTCRVLPLCQGGCVCCRINGEDVCHDAKDCIEELVLDYYHALISEENL